MFELVLAVIFGFALALFVVLLAAPVVSRRIIALTWRQAETALPMTMDEIAADRDRLRADHAILARRIEMDLEKRDEQLRLERLSTAKQRDKIETLQGDIEKLQAINADLDQKLELAKKEQADLNAMLGVSQETIDETASELAEAKALIVTLKRNNEHLKIESSNADIERVALETQIDQLRLSRTDLSDRAKALREQVTEQRSRAKIAESEAKTATQKFNALDKSFQKLTAGFTDLEERFERNQRMSQPNDDKVGAQKTMHVKTVQMQAKPTMRAKPNAAPLKDPVARFEALKPRIEKVQNAGPKARESLRAELFDITALLVADATRKAGPNSRLATLVGEADGTKTGLAAEIAKAHRALEKQS